MKFSDFVAEDLARRGYSHCFFVPGGNIMHLVDSLSKTLKMIPVVHEHTAIVAADYFNYISRGENQFALALVTTGPGITNSISGLAGAWLESRQLLVVAGQVKSSDLKDGDLRQRGIQEVDGCGLVRPIVSLAKRFDSVPNQAEWNQSLEISPEDRAGPVFIEVCLDVQAARFGEGFEIIESQTRGVAPKARFEPFLNEIFASLGGSSRPVILLGDDVPFNFVDGRRDEFLQLGIPILSTWNGINTVGDEFPFYAGRTDTWGQRSANLIIQQADLILAIGTRLAMQTTGFAWQEFGKNAEIFHVFWDSAEGTKLAPKPRRFLQARGGEFLAEFIESVRTDYPGWQSWTELIREIRRSLPLNEARIQVDSTYINTFDFVETLGSMAPPGSIFIPSSSGGAETSFMQVFRRHQSHLVVTSSSLASMGYGLAGAIGAGFRDASKVVLIEGDGGFAQNLQDLGTVAVNELNIIMFIYSNNGYASIRTTQKNYFGGNFVGVDRESGLALPNWEKIAAAFSLPFGRLSANFEWQADLGKWLQEKGPMLVEVLVDPEQDYFPKISSTIDGSGKMRSNPIHLMSPMLSESSLKHLGPFLGGGNS